LNFSDTPTNHAYYGLRNSDSPIESTNPADYVWYKVTGGFGTTKFLYYLTTGGRQIQFAVSTSVPNAGWIQDSGAAIDLDITTKTNAVANFVVIRVANNSAAPTDSECVTAIGRTPMSGDLCTVNYNSGIASIQYESQLDGLYSKSILPLILFKLKLFLLLLPIWAALLLAIFLLEVHLLLVALL
jgi:hypothetical protein